MPTRGGFVPSDSGGADRFSPCDEVPRRHPFKERPHRIAAECHISPDVALNRAIPKPNQVVIEAKIDHPESKPVVRAIQHPPSLIWCSLRHEQIPHFLRTVTIGIRQANMRMVADGLRVKLA
jgi:hypothetical protein